MAEEESHMENNIFNNVTAQFVRPGTRTPRLIGIIVREGGIFAEETSVKQRVTAQWLEDGQKKAIKFSFSGLGGYSYEVKEQDNPDVFGQIAEACGLS